MRGKIVQGREDHFLKLYTNSNEKSIRIIGPEQKALHRFMCRADGDDPKEARDQFGFIDMEIPMSLEG